MSNSVVPVCRVCLADNIKMHSIRNTLYQEMFEKLSGTKLVTKDGRPQTVCYICHSQLQRIGTFYNMTQNSEKKLSKVLKGAKRLTKKKVALLEKEKNSLSVTFMKIMSTDDESDLTKTVVHHLRHEHSYCKPSEETYVIEGSLIKPTVTVDNAGSVEGFPTSLYDADTIDQSNDTMESIELHPEEIVSGSDLLCNEAMVLSRSLSPKDQPSETPHYEPLELSEMGDNASEGTQAGGNSSESGINIANKQNKKVNLKGKRKVFELPKNIAHLTTKSIETPEPSDIEETGGLSSDNDTSQTGSCKSYENVSIGPFDFQMGVHWSIQQREKAKARLRDKTNVEKASNDQAKDKPSDVEANVAHNPCDPELPNEKDKSSYSGETQILQVNDNKLSNTGDKDKTSHDKPETEIANVVCMTCDKETSHLNDTSDTGIAKYVLYKAGADELPPDYESEDDVSQVNDKASNIGISYPLSNPENGNDNAGDISSTNIMYTASESGMGTSINEDAIDSGIAKYIVYKPSDNELVEMKNNSPSEISSNKSSDIQVVKKTTVQIPQTYSNIKKKNLKNKLSDLEETQLKFLRDKGTAHVEAVPRMNLRSKSIDNEGIQLRGNSTEKPQMQLRSNSIDTESTRRGGNSSDIGAAKGSRQGKSVFKTPQKRKKPIHVAKTPKKSAKVAQGDKSNAMAHLDDEMERFINEVDVKVESVDFVSDIADITNHVKAASDKTTEVTAPTLDNNIIDVNDKATVYVISDEKEPNNEKSCNILDVSVTMERIPDDESDSAPPINNNETEKDLKGNQKTKSSKRKNIQNETAKDLEEIYQKTMTVKHIKGLSFPCEICKRRFKTDIALKTHKTERHKSTCFVCGKTLSNSGHLKSHMLIHTGEKPFVCKVCGKRTNNKSNLTKHMAVHSGTKPYCKICHRVISGMSLKEHNMKLHPEDEQHPCTKCGKKFTSINSLKLHIKSHARKAPFTCDLCAEKFNHMILLKRHVFNMHIV